MHLQGVLECISPDTLSDSEDEDVRRQNIAENHVRNSWSIVNPTH